MSDLLDKIRRAQVNAGEMAVVQDLHDRGLCDKPTCELCQSAPVLPAVPHDMLAQTLTDKIAMMLLYCEDLRGRIRPRDNEAFNSLLDDPEVAAWLTTMRNTGRGRNTRFTGRN